MNPVTNHDEGSLTSGELASLRAQISNDRRMMGRDGPLNWSHLAIKLQLPLLSVKRYGAAIDTEVIHALSSDEDSSEDDDDASSVEYIPSSSSSKSTDEYEDEDSDKDWDENKNEDPGPSHRKRKRNTYNGTMLLAEFTNEEVYNVTLNA
jgi:hypothetical protein